MSIDPQFRYIDNSVDDHIVGYNSTYMVVYNIINQNYYEYPLDQ